MSFLYDDNFRNAAEILTEEEYFAKVGFDRKLLDSFNLLEPNGTYYWQQNHRQGYIEHGRFGQRDSPIQWSLPMEHGGPIVLLNFGDLLIHLGREERIVWKKFFKSTTSKLENAVQLLFPESQEDMRLSLEYWRSREKAMDESIDLPWLTREDKQKMAEELSYLNQFDGEKNEWRDLRIMKFRPEVLNRYKQNAYCKLKMDDTLHCILKFLRYDKKDAASTLRFFIKDGIICARSEDFIEVPPKERKHWHEHEVNENKPSET